eukprot:Gb_00707 [translate_table: standard]
MEALSSSSNWADQYPALMNANPLCDSIPKPPRMVACRASAANGKESVKDGEGLEKESVVEIIRGGVSAEGKKPWWAPIFGMQPSRNNDHKHSTVATNVTSAAVGCRSLEVAPQANPKVPKRAVFTAEKARLLRKELRATESWHDLMYHSAIASRLAFPDDD